MNCNGEPKGPKNPVGCHVSITQNPLPCLWLFFTSTTTVPSQCTSGNTAWEAVVEPSQLAGNSASVTLNKEVKEILGKANTSLSESF